MNFFLSQYASVESSQKEAFNFCKSFKLGHIQPLLLPPAQRI